MSIFFKFSHKVLLVLLPGIIAISAECQTKEESGFLRFVDPRIGNVGHLLQPTRPVAHLPNQVIRMYPQRNDYMDDQISSFPLTIVSHRLGEAFSVKPCARLNNDGSLGSKMPYDHDLEVTRPWYYSTYLLKDDIQVEFTPGRKGGIFRFVFPKGKAGSVLFGVYNDGNSEYKFLSDRELTGVEIYHGNIPVYMYGTFNIAPMAKGTGKGSLTSENTAVEEKGAKAWVSFAGDASNTIEFRYAISFISAEQARKNYNAELSSVSFSQLKDSGEKLWSDKINQIKVEGGTDAQKRSFYTALYRCYERMVDITEDGKYFSGFDHKIHTTSRPFYVDDWTWDTYLAHHPLNVILNPSKEEDILNSYVLMYQQSGWMPTFPVLFGDHACMNGFHSSIMFLDAYRKGLRNFDAEKAYEGMRKNAMMATMLPWRNGSKGPLDDFYHTKGYFPALKPGEKETDTMVHVFEKRQAVAVTLGNSYDDWAVGEMARELGKQADRKLFNHRASNYKNLWNDEVQLFLPKDEKGNWIKIDPVFDGGMGARDYYDENNGWTYLWQVQQDIEGLISLMKGKDKFESRLDQLFREGLGRSKYEFWAKLPDATGLVGQYSMGNEPSFHIPYLYNYTRSPWKTQQRVRFLLDTWFKDNVFGIPGDEDGGGMSAFVVFSSMGFYPVTPGLPKYTIGSLLFSKVTIDLPSGKQFTVKANNSSVVNKYIQSASLNGKPLNTPWFSHEQLVSGGILELEMGPKPNKLWGTEQ